MRCGAVPPANDCSNAGQHQQGNIGSHAAGILEPLADVQSNDVQQHSDHKHGQRDSQQEGAVLRESRTAAADDICAHRCAGQQQAGKVEDGINPIGPAGDKAVKGSKGLFGPGVEPALVWKA